MKNIKIISYDEWEKNYMIATALRDKLNYEIDFLDRWLKYNDQEPLYAMENDLEIEMKLMLEYVDKCEMASAADDTEPLLNGKYWQKVIMKYMDHKEYFHERSAKIERQEIPTGPGQEGH